MNRRELLRLAPCVLGLAAFRPRVSTKNKKRHGRWMTYTEFQCRRSKPGIDSVEGLGLHPDDIERI